MIVKFEKEYLEELYRTGKCSDKKHRYQPQIVRKYQYCIGALATAPSVEALFRHNALCYEVLGGDKAGVSSIRVNDRYRIEFTVTESGVEPFAKICNVIELSNHYK